MPDFPDEIFSESSYDDTSGEYFEAFDFEPIFSQRVYLNEEGTLWADVFSTDDYQGTFDDVINELEDLAGNRTFEIDFNNKNPDDKPPLPDNFDFGDPNIRGPFIDPDHVREFLKVTGFGNTANVYYDEDNDEFWIDLYPE